MPPTNTPPLLVQIARLLTFYTLAISLRVTPVAAPILIERYFPGLRPLANACRHLTNRFPALFTALWTILELTMFSILSRDTGRLLERLGLFPRSSRVREPRRPVSGVNDGAEAEDGVANPPSATSSSRLQPEEEQEAIPSPPSSTDELFSLTAGVNFAMARIFSNNVVSPQRSIWQNIPAVLMSLLWDLGFVAAALWLQSRRRSATGGRGNAGVGEGEAKMSERTPGQRFGGTAERKY
ncbi:hypothetical protein R3P38DRAFT_2827660 [Favolaschia claudopus]|uniref:Uncharacterized protein n=1 Tax=Favolaschia claudopus TaxID=2862362 RepID=A0AAW0EJQ3_9AGAR